VLSNGALPNFLVIGAARCGTTLLHECLKEHPEIYVPHHVWKEVHFFDRESNYIRGIEYYRTFFQDIRQEKMIGEVTPNYLFSRICAERIAFHLDRSSLKFVVSLRNPVEMLYSYYKHQYIGGWYKTFHDFIRGEDDIVRRGFYIEHINEYLRYFPRENLHCLVFEDLPRDAQGWIRSVYKFLGVANVNFVPRVVGNETKVYASSSRRYRGDVVTRSVRGLYQVAKGAPFLGWVKAMVVPLFMEEFDRIEEDDRKLLRQIYEPYNERLCKFLGRDLGW
jgi:hypothetical protein